MSGFEMSAEAAADLRRQLHEQAASRVGGEEVIGALQGSAPAAG